MPLNNPAQHALLIQTVCGLTGGAAASEALNLASLDPRELADVEAAAIQCQETLATLLRLIDLERKSLAQRRRDAEDL